MGRGEEGKIRGGGARCVAWSGRRHSVPGGREAGRVPSSTRASLPASLHLSPSHSAVVIMTHPHPHASSPPSFSSPSSPLLPALPPRPLTHPHPHASSPPSSSSPLPPAALPTWPTHQHPHGSATTTTHQHPHGAIHAGQCRGSRPLKEEEKDDEEDGQEILACMDERIDTYCIRCKQACRLEPGSPNPASQQSMPIWASLRTKLRFYIPPSYSRPRPPPGCHR